MGLFTCMDASMYMKSRPLEQILGAENMKANDRAHLNKSLPTTSV
jgi:hypothetical protein